MHRSLLVAAALLVSCFDPATERPPPGEEQRTDVLEGELCSLPSGGVRPLKVLIALDASQSLSVTDPNGTRARAVTELIDRLPQDVETSVAVMLFTDSLSAWLVSPFLQQFVRASEISAAERAAIADRILTFVPPPGVGTSTDFVNALSNVYAAIARDIAVDNAAGRTPASYAVVFVSDGAPTSNQDDQLLCGDSVARIRALRDLGGDVRVHTALVFVPVLPATTCNESLPAGAVSCRLPVPPPDACPQTVIGINADRLKRMAALGGGEFREFRAGAPVDFGFVAERLQPAFSMGTIVVSNLSAAPSTGEADSDGDGLTDALEAMLGTNPDARDSDGDGFGDGVERWVELGRERDPSRFARLMEGCTAGDKDSDCDGLTDCDEKVLSSNTGRADSDDDGLPDAVEFQHATRPELSDHLTDFDVDGTPNGDEVRQHTDPWKKDPAKPERAYRYTLTPAAGAGCFAVRVENVQAPKTRSGQSTLLLSASLKAEGTDRPVAAIGRVTVTSGQPLPVFKAAQVRVGCSP